MGIRGFTGGNKKAFKKASDINIINRYRESERFLDKVYKGVTNLRYGTSTVLARTWREQSGFLKR
jgi:hypothetical protein